MTRTESEENPEVLSESEDESSQREKIIRITEALLERCDGARKRDGAGFNKFDAKFVRDVMSSDELTDNQVEALRGSLIKYKEQIEGMGMDYTALTDKYIGQEEEEDDDEGDSMADEIEADIQAYNVHDNKYSKRVSLDSPYEAKDDIKSLDWDKVHYNWNNGEKAWDVDLQSLSYVMEKLQKKDWTVGVKQEVKEAYREVTGFDLFPDKIDIEVREVKGGNLKVVESDGEREILGETTVEKNAMLNFQTPIDGETDEITLKIKVKSESKSNEVDIHVGEKWAQVKPQDVTESIDRILYNKLSYSVQGAKFTTAYKNNDWDGRERLYKKKSSKAPSGLAYQMKKILEDEGFQVNIIDERDAPESQVEYEWNFPYELRDYQVESVQKALQKNGIINLPTGAGKTVVGLKVIQELGQKALVLVHKKELLYQWIDEIEDNLGVSREDIGIIGDGNWKEEKITVAMLQTLGERGIDNLETDFGLMMVDETHHLPADSFYKVATDIDTYYKFGLSATAYRNDNADMKIWAGLGDITTQVTAEELIDEGYLSRPQFEVLDWDREYLFSGSYDKQRQQMRESDNRNEAIVQRAEELRDEGYKVLVDVYRINHGKQLADMIDCEFVYGDSPEETRKKAVERFEGAEDGKVIVSTLLDEGVDIPDLNAIILTDIGKSSIKTIQTIGRALRPKNGDEAKIIDIDDRDAGKYMRDHFKSRQRAMSDYYGKYYNKDW